MSYIVRVLWEGEILSERDHGNSETLASAHFDSVVSDYLRKDDSEGIAVQMINGDRVEWEHCFGPSEWCARCPACGDYADYCQGHGEIGDPDGFAILEAHDNGDHSNCHPLSNDCS